MRISTIGFSGLVLAMGFAAAPALSAQSARARGQVLVCRDGFVTSTRYGEHACDRHRGVDRQATVQARRYGVYDANGTDDANRGVYNGGVYNGGVYNGGVYDGGVYDGSVYGAPSRGVYNGNGSVYGQTNGERSVYGGGVNNGTSRSVYGSTVYGTPNGTYDRDQDGDQDGGHGRGHAYGHDKGKHHHDGDN